MSNRTPTPRKRKAEKEKEEEVEEKERQDKRKKQTASSASKKGKERKVSTGKKKAKKETTKEEELDDEAWAVQDAVEQEFEFDKICTSLKYKYKIEIELGTGSFGRVYRGTDIIAHRPVAIKFINNLSDRPDALEDELKVMLRLEHPNIVKLVDILNYWDGWMVVVMELCLGGTLIYDVVENTRNGLSDRRSKGIFRQIAEAVNYLHKNNILLKHKGKDEIRIVDFGSARILDSGQEKLTTFSGAEVIRAPEITKENNPYDPTKCDSWSLGCILYKMLTNDWPNASIHASKKQLAFPYKISQNCRTLLTNLLDPAKRWSTEQILKCDWLRNEDVTEEKKESKETPQSSYCTVS